jgi:hypothetical protein
MEEKKKPLLIFSRDEQYGAASGRPDFGSAMRHESSFLEWPRARVTLS